MMFRYALPVATACLGIKLPVPSATEQINIKTPERKSTSGAYLPRTIAQPTINSTTVPIIIPAAAIFCSFLVFFVLNPEQILLQILIY